MKTASADGFTAVRLPDPVFRETEALLRALTQAHKDTGIFVIDRSYNERWGDTTEDVPAYVRRMWRDICASERRPCITATISGQRGHRLVSVTIPKRAATKPIIAWAGLVAAEQSSRWNRYKAAELKVPTYNVSSTIFDLFIPEPCIETVWEQGFLRMCREDWAKILKVGG